MTRKNEFLRSAPGRQTRNVFGDVMNILVPVLLCALGFVVMCQKFAGLVGYAPEHTGLPLFRLPFGLPGLRKGYPVFNPLEIALTMVTAFVHPDIQAACLASVFWFVGFSFAAVVVFLVMSALKSARNRNDSLYGTARWADYRKDLKAFGLTMQRGVVLAQRDDARITAKVNPANASVSLRMRKNAPLVAHSGGTNTMVVAPTRSGKGVGCVIPTALSWPGSMIILDPKGEIYNITAGYRRKFSHVLKFSPVSDETVHYNPLADFRYDKTLGSYIDLITSIIFDRGGGDGKDDFWANSASSYFNSVVAHVLTSQMYPEKEKNIAAILRLIKRSAAEKTKDAQGNETESGGEGLINEMLAGAHFDDAGVHREYLDHFVQGGANQMKSMNPKVRSDVFSTLFSKVGLFEDAYIAELTSRSDFSLDDFYDSERPVSLYMTVPFGQMARVMPIFKLIINFILNYFSSNEIRLGEKERKLRNRLLFLLDEFPALGKQEQLMNNMAQLAGFGITFFIIVQELKQLDSIYGDKNTFFANCKTVMAYASGEYETAQKLSNIIGKESVTKESVSSSGNRYQLMMNNLSFSSQEVARELINPDEIMKLPPNQCLIINQGMPPYIAKKNVYYDDPRFKFIAFSDHKVSVPKTVWLKAPFDFDLFGVRKGDRLLELAVPFLHDRIIPGFPAPYTPDEIAAECRGLPSNRAEKARRGAGAGGFDPGAESRALSEENTIRISPAEEGLQAGDFLETVNEGDSYGVPEDNLVAGDEPPPTCVDFNAMYFMDGGRDAS